MTIEDIENDISKMIVRIFERCDFQEDGCMMWTGFCDRSSPVCYGVTIKNYLWKLFNEINGKFNIKNTCGKDKCINIDHMFVLDKWKSVELRLSEGTVIYEETGCHLWTKKTDDDGYGTMSFGRSSITTHRASYMITNGIKFLSKNVLIRHKCIEKTCNNPDHLERGTALDNSNDRKRDNTLPSGEKNIRATITNELAREIKHSKYPKNHKKYKFQKHRAKEFGVSLDIVRAIDCSASWGHIKDRHGNVTTKDHEKNRTRAKLRKKQVFTIEQYEIAKDRLKEKSILTIENRKGCVSGYCWEHQNKPVNGKYPKVSFFGYQIGVHIWGAMIRNGRRRNKDDNVVRHLCSNKICCNPDHVDFGTKSDNAIDFIKTGSSNAKLDEDKVREIRTSTKSIKELSMEYEVKVRSIRAVLNNKSWKWVK